MAGLFKKLQSAAHNRTTYRVGLLQVKAFRILKQYTDEGLAAYGLSNVDWGFLGLLDDNPQGMRAKALALELGVEPPFVTELFNRLKKRGLVDAVRDATDSRAKIISLTTQGSADMELIEKNLRSHMKQLLIGAGMGDLLSYVSTLETIIGNAKK